MGAHMENLHWNYYDETSTKTIIFFLGGGGGGWARLGVGLVRCHCIGHVQYCKCDIKINGMDNKFLLYLSFMKEWAFIYKLFNVLWCHQRSNIEESKCGCTYDHEMVHHTPYFCGCHVQYLKSPQSPLHVLEFLEGLEKLCKSPWQKTMVSDCEPLTVPPSCPHFPYPKN